MIKPIDQKNSNTSDVIIFAAPFVMSITEIMQNGFVSNYNYWKKIHDQNESVGFDRTVELNLHIIEPDVYIKAHDDAVKKRKSTCNS